MHKLTRSFSGLFLDLLCKAKIAILWVSEPDMAYYKHLQPIKIEKQSVARSSVGRNFLRGSQKYPLAYFRFGSVEGTIILRDPEACPRLRKCSKLHSITGEFSAF